VAALEVEENTLGLEMGRIVPRGTGRSHLLSVDTILFAIGDRVDSRIGLPASGYEFMKNPSPLFPVDGESYEIFDPSENRPVEGLFMAGWARKASTGLVGVARKDGVMGAAAILQYLEREQKTPAATASEIMAGLKKAHATLVTKEDLAVLEENERQAAASLGLPVFRYATNEEMLKVIGGVEETCC